MSAGQPNVAHLLALFSQKKNTFSYDFEVGQPTGQLMCVFYKFSLTGGFTLHLGHTCLLLLFDCLRSDLSVHVLQLFILSSLLWYCFKWFCVFLFMTLSSVLIL